MTPEEKRHIDTLKQVLERTKNYSSLSAIEKLEEENEKLKCCGNCRHKFEPTQKGGYIMPCEATEYKPCNRWELKE